jgi:hypothetical protein
VKPTYRQVLQSLYLCEPHHCCEYAEAYLYPPQRGTEGRRVELSGGGTLQVHPKPYWDIDDGDGGAVIAVKFCPWCGLKLPGGERC